ncbi:MAG: hypothetical protein P4L69_24345 [Desulfosporosinus sp.]|nr:hypothetical protein [Desulfosporosinus sp.]
MAYTSDQWVKRNARRSDISVFLTHLTKSSSYRTALDVLLKILSDKTLVGSTTFILLIQSRICLWNSWILTIGQEGGQYDKLFIM